MRVKTRPAGCSNEVWRQVCSCPGNTVEGVSGVIPVKEMTPDVSTSLVHHKNCGGVIAHVDYNFRECWNCEQWFVVPYLKYTPVDCPGCVNANA